MRERESDLITESCLKSDLHVKGCLALELKEHSLMCGTAAHDSQHIAEQLWTLATKK